MFKLHRNGNESGEKMVGEKELETYMDGDLRCVSHLPANFGGVGDRYCQCGKKRAPYSCEFANLWYTNVSCGGGRETSDDILKVDRNAVFLTKKSLTMNQFLEYTNSAPPPSPRKSVADPVSWLRCSFPRSRLAICDVQADSAYDRSSAKCDPRTVAPTCASSPLLDKRVVSLLRGITLYWFICLNTVLAKSELLKKKSPIVAVDDLNRDSATILDAISATDSVPPFFHAVAELQLSLNLLENACDLEGDILWNLFRDSFIEQSQLKQAVIVLPADQHSKNNSLERFVHQLVNGWIAMLRNFDRMSARYCPYNMVPAVTSGQDERRELREIAQDEHGDDVNCMYHWPEVEIHPVDVVSPSPLYRTFLPILGSYPVDDYIGYALVNDGIPYDEAGAYGHHQEAILEFDQNHPSMSYSVVTFDANECYSSDSAGRSDASFPFETDRSQPAVNVDAVAAPSNSTGRARSVSADRGLLGNVAGETPDVRVSRRSASLDRYGRAPSPARPFHPYDQPTAVPDGSDDAHDRVFVPLQSFRSEMSHAAFWKLIADKFGDPETNAAFANDAANRKAEYNLEGALMPADDQPEENVMVYGNHLGVGDWQNNVAATNGVENRTFEHHQLENGDEMPVQEFEGEARNSSFSPSARDSERARLTQALHYGIRLVDARFADVDEGADRCEPTDRGSDAVNEQRHRNLIDEDELPQIRLSTVASNPSARIDPSYGRVAELRSDLSSPSARISGACWSQSALADGCSDVNIDACHQLRNEDTNDSKETSANAATVPGDYQLFGCDHVLAPSYRSSASRLASQLQRRTADSSSSIANSNSLFDNGSDPRSPLPSVGADQTAWPETSELSLEYADHDRRSALLASRSTSNNSGATKEGDAPSSESDDSELVALTHPSSAQLPPAEHRYFLPQGILGGGQQECAEFNMWRWPWVNSVQLLCQEPLRPRAADSEYPPYQMWKVPLLNVVQGRRSKARSPALSTLASDAGASSEYSLWSSPKLVDVEQLSAERQEGDATNPTPSNAPAAGLHFPPFVPRGRLAFSDRGAFQYYRRPDGDMAPRTRSPAQCAAPDSDEEVRQLTDDEADSPYVFRPLAPAFKVPKDVQPPMLRSASGLEYQQNGRKLLAFEHELDAKSTDPYRFRPKYAVSLNDKGCQTEPELLYASRFAANSTQGWPSPPRLAAQHPWPSYQAQPWPPFWTAQQPDAQWAAEPLQYYSLNDVFSHLGQPGFANVGEYDLPLAMTFLST